MMRLPWFEYRAPRTVAEAAALLAERGADAMPLAGGTDLLPNMKRRQQAPKILVSLRNIAALKQVTHGAGLKLGAGVTLTRVIGEPQVREHYRALYQAASQVATVHLRNMGTLGGNLCLDTRCSYYNQNYEWRKAIDFCLKKDGDTCWVATASKRCVAMSSTDCAPALMALGATVRLVCASGEREIPLEALYNNDGMDYLAKRPEELLTEITLPGALPRSTYWKLRRRGAFDFPVLGVAAAARLAADGTVQAARIALGAVASRPFLAEKPAQWLIGKKLTDEVIAEAAALAGSRAKPMDNADLDLYWRKEVAPQYVGYALRELRGDDMREIRLKTARQSLT